jgi:hypothetical protein
MQRGVCAGKALARRRHAKCVQYTRRVAASAGSVRSIRRVSVITSTHEYSLRNGASAALQCNCSVAALQVRQKRIRTVLETKGNASVVLRRPDGHSPLPVHLWDSIVCAESERFTGMITDVYVGTLYRLSLSNPTEPRQRLTTMRSQGDHMSRKDFVLIASIIQQLPSFECSQDSDVVRHSAIVARFAEALARTNPKFDSARFEKACNGR